MVYPSFHSVGISSCSHIFPIRSCSISVEVSISALIASAGILFGPKVSCLHVMDGFLNLCLTWSFVVYLEYFFGWCDVWRVLSLLAGSAVRQNVPSIWYSSLVSTLPFLSLMGLSVCLYFPSNFLII